jgi:gas vesicle protein
MKNKKLLFALAAGVAAVGTIAYLLTTDEGKKARKKMRRKANEVTEELENVIKDAKQKFSNWKESLTEGCRREEEILPER